MELLKFDTRKSLLKSLQVRYDIFTVFFFFQFQYHTRLFAIEFFRVFQPFVQCVLIPFTIGSRKRFVFLEIAISDDASVNAEQIWSDLVLAAIVDSMAGLAFFEYLLTFFSIAISKSGSSEQA